MLPVLIWGLVFVVSLFVLIKAADYFTESAEKIGIHIGMPPFIVGVLIVALGTSLPEIVSSVVAVLQGSSEIVVGNVVGSNIANIFLVLGVAAIVGKQLKITHEILKVDLPLMAGSTFLLAVMIWDGVYTIHEAVLSLLAFTVYVFYSLSGEEDKDIKKEMSAEMRKEKRRELDGTWVVLIVSAAFIYLGAKYTIDSIISLSSILNIGTEIIAVSAVALGTSLPELMVSVKAAKSGKPEMAIGNVLGSNIFNALAVMGIPALLGTLVIPESILTFSLPMLIVGTLMFFFMTQDRETTSWEGGLLVIFYIFFIGKLFNVF